VLVSDTTVTQRWPEAVTLLERWLDGEATQGEFERLDAALSQSSELARYASQRLAEHRVLGVLHQSTGDDLQCAAILDQINARQSADVDKILDVVKAASVSAHVPSASSRFPVRRLAMLVACTVTVIIAGLLVWNREPAYRQVAIQSTDVATVLLTEECRWRDGQIISEGQRLGGRLDLVSGLAVLRFDGGAELILRGDSELELLSSGESMLHRGDVVVRASEVAAGFRLLTPSSELIDLGTEFSVRVADAGATTLSVLEGEVSVRPLDSVNASPQILQAGKAVMVDDSRSVPREVQAIPERFESVVRAVHPVGRSDLMYAYEGFFYDAGAVPLSESRRGKGWAGSWRQRTKLEGYRDDEDVTDTLDIVHGQMNVTWPVPGGKLGMLQLPPGKTFRIRELQRPIDLGADGIYYFSFMVREPDYERRLPKARPQEGVRLTFRNSDDYYGESLSFGISAELHPQLRTGRGVGFFSAADAPSNQTTLWIGKVISRERGADEVSFRIFSESDELTYAEPSAWHVVSHGLDLSARLNLVVLTSQGAASRIVDELRIGPTWRSVTPLGETN
jgi:hypothetical protein